MKDVDKLLHDNLDTIVDRLTADLQTYNEYDPDPDEYYGNGVNRVTYEDDGWYIEAEIQCRRTKYLGRVERELSDLYACYDDEDSNVETILCNDDLKVLAAAIIEKLNQK